MRPPPLLEGRSEGGCSPPRHNPPPPEHIAGGGQQAHPPQNAVWKGGSPRLLPTAPTQKRELLSPLLKRGSCCPTPQIGWYRGGGAAHLFSPPQSGKLGGGGGAPHSPSALPTEVLPEGGARRAPCNATARGRGRRLPGLTRPARKPARKPRVTTAVPPPTACDPREWLREPPPP